MVVIQKSYLPKSVLNHYNLGLVSEFLPYKVFGDSTRLYHVLNNKSILLPDFVDLNTLEEREVKIMYYCRTRTTNKVIVLEDKTMGEKSIERVLPIDSINDAKVYNAYLLIGTLHQDIEGMYDLKSMSVRKAFAEAIPSLVGYYLMGTSICFVYCIILSDSIEDSFSEKLCIANRYSHKLVSIGELDFVHLSEASNKLKPSLVLVKGV
jgi:hypothetical protein